MTKNYSIVWFPLRDRMDPDEMTMDEANRNIPGKFFIPRDARMCGL